MIRAFIALELSSATRSVLTEVVADLKRLKLHGRPVDPASIHLTLKFLGGVQPELLSPIRRRLTEVARNTSPFQLSLRRLGVFPGLKRARVVWFGVDPSDPLQNLHQQIEQEMESLGFEPETRPFKPHLTLMRLKSPTNLAALAHYLQEHEAKANAGRMEVEEFVLFQSVLKPNGAEYRKLATLPLGQSLRPEAVDPI